MPKQPRLDALERYTMSLGGQSRGREFSATNGIRETSYPACPRFAGQVFGWSMAGRAPFVLSSSGGADGLSGSVGGTFSWGDHIGSGSGGPFGKSS